MSNNKNKRIYILGVSGSGKSTLAKKLSKKFKIPHYDLDDVYYIKKYTKKRSLEKKKEMADRLAERDNWVIEGVYSSFTDEILKRSTQIIWLNIGLGKSIFRVTKRYLKRAPGERESFSNFWLLLKAVIRSQTKGGMHSKQKALLSKYKRKNLIIIKNNKGLDCYLGSLGD